LLKLGAGLTGGCTKLLKRRKPTAIYIRHATASGPYQRHSLHSSPSEPSHSIVQLPNPHPHNGRGPKLLAALQRRRPPSRRRKGLPNDATTNEAFVRPLHLLPHVRPHTPIANIRVALIARPVAHHFNLPARTQSSSSTRAPSKTTKTSPTCLSPAVQTPQIHVYEIYAPSPAYDLALKTSLYFPPEHQLEIPILPLTVWASRCAIPDLDDCYGRG
jgi:hypothetical protein